MKGLVMPLRGLSPLTVKFVVVLLFVGWLSNGSKSYFPNATQANDALAPTEIRAKRFVVVDSAGKDRAELGLLKEDEVGLIVWNKDRTASLTVGVDQSETPRMGFANREGYRLLDLGLSENKAPVIALSDAEGRKRLGAIVTENGTVGIALYALKNHNQYALTVTREGDVQIILKDQAERKRALLKLDEKGVIALELSGPNGTPGVRFQVDANGKPDGAIVGSDGKTIWSPANP
jgi:hypothetical protein